ncbi:MAG: hypothetical protein MJE68_01895, partial [Proteobacteria bacterium]|nr:hypothetical protein [Pseudomonadota bacterium]
CLMEELETLLEQLFFHLEFWQTVWRNLKQIRREDFIRYQRVRSQFAMLVTPTIHRLATEFRHLSFKDLEKEGGTFFVNRYTPDEVEAERYQCPKNRLKEAQDKSSLVQKQGVQLVLKPFKVEPLKLCLVEESDDKEVPELVSDLQGVDHQWLKMMAEYTALRVTFL